MIMPDHIHLFALQRGRQYKPINEWVGWWKRELSRELFPGCASIWQKGCWDTRVYSEEAYVRKLRYVEDNPVRAGLVMDKEAWPYKGVIHTLRWVEDPFR